MQDTIGIDISKDTLDIHRQSDGRHARFGNDKVGLAALRRWIGKAPSASSTRRPGAITATWRVRWMRRATRWSR